MKRHSGKQQALVCKFPAYGPYLVFRGNAFTELKCEDERFSAMVVLAPSSAFNASTSGVKRNDFIESSIARSNAGGVRPFGD